MSKFTNPLNNIKIASPCSADWNEMMGNERKRFCGDCKLNVYNLSGMSQMEAENLLMYSEGRLCVRFYRRADGSVLTKDCPVGWKAIKQRASKIVTAFASLVFAALSGIGLANYFAISRMENSTIGEIAIDETNSNTSVQEKPIAMMGNFSVRNNQTTGMLSNVAEVKQKISVQRKR